MISRVKNNRRSGAWWIKKAQRPIKFKKNVQEKHETYFLQ